MPQFSEGFPGFPKLSEIVNFIELCGSDSLETFGGRFEGGYYVQQDPQELGQLIYWLKTSLMVPRPMYNYLEIGSAAGGTMRVLHDVGGLIWNAYVIDDNKHPRHVHRPKTLGKTEVKEFIGDSHSMECARWLKNLDKKFHMVYIDGDHSFAGVKADTELVLPYLDRDAIVVYHDTRICWEVRQFIRHLRYTGELMYLREFDERQGITVFKECKHGNWF